MKNNLFKVSVSGLREQQLGKSKTIIIRELLQNALDEQIKTCSINLKYEHGKAKITVTDDSPEGFRDLSDSYTLFASTPKRSDVKKRGRYNFGEKQIIVICDYARIVSTKGGVEFFVLDGERRDLRRKRPVGSEIYVEVKMTHDEYFECINYCSQILIPENIKIELKFSHPNSDEEKDGVLFYSKPDKTFTATLPTEIKEDDYIKTVRRETEVFLYKSKRDEKNQRNETMIYEMGIPICPIDCEYSIDVQQKVPLSADRDKVDGKYLKALYADVLNHTFADIKDAEASSTWVRSAIETGNANKEAVITIVKERYGDKVAFSNPFNPVSDDDAKANGYKLVHGNELSKEERNAFKEYGAVQTSSEIFRVNGLPATHVTPDKQQLKVYKLTERIAVEFLGFKPMISLVDCRGATVLATFSESGTVTYYNNKIPKSWWQPDADGYVTDEMLELIIHELCHKFGHHCDRPYLDKITWLASKLVRKQREEKSFFKIA